MAMPQRDNVIEEIKRLDLLLEYAVQHGDEAVGAEFLHFPLSTLRSFFGDAEHLLFAVAEGDDHDAAHLELLHQGLGYFGGAAGDDDTVVAAVESLVAVAEEALHTVAQFLK